MIAIETNVLLRILVDDPTAPERETPRLGKSLSHRINYQQRRKKACF